MTGETQDNTWPLPKFYFTVKLGLKYNPVFFQEISGLELETQAIEYRHDDIKQFSAIRMPELAKGGNVTLKKGVFLKDNNFFKWYGSLKMNTIKRETVTIQLLDENGKPTMTWTLLNAWPTKISVPDLKSDANEVAVETLEIAHEGLQMQKHEM
jgi:phage tail-like protein